MWAALIPVVLTFCVLGLVAWLLGRHTIKRTGRIVLLQGEERVAEIFAQCKELTYGGAVFRGTAHDGRLLLTTRRLIHTNTLGDRVGLVLLRNHIHSIAKGKHGPLMSLELDYQTPGMKAPKHARFIQVTSMPGMDPSQQLPIGMFIDKLLAWKQVA